MTTERVLMELIEKAREKCKRQYEELRTDYENFSHRMRDLDDAEHVVEERFRVTGGKV
jgi:flagellar biosynthesis chaperone FliJ